MLNLAQSDPAALLKKLEALAAELRAGGTPDVFLLTSRQLTDAEMEEQPTPAAGTAAGTAPNTEISAMVTRPPGDHTETPGLMASAYVSAEFIINQQLYEDPSRRPFVELLQTLRCLTAADNAVFGFAILMPRQSPLGPLGIQHALCAGYQLTTTALRAIESAVSVFRADLERQAGEQQRKPN